MRFYETTIVLDPQADDATVGREIEKVTQTILDLQGQLVTTQKWGVKRMAYPIQKHHQAAYVHFVYQSPPAVPARLESMFRINENILRHLTVLVEGPLPRTRPVDGRTEAYDSETPAMEPAAESAPEPVAAAETDDESDDTQS